MTPINKTALIVDVYCVLVKQPFLSKDYIACSNDSKKHHNNYHSVWKYPVHQPSLSEVCIMHVLKQ